MIRLLAAVVVMAVSVTFTSLAKAEEIIPFGKDSAMRVYVLCSGPYFAEGIFKAERSGDVGESERLQRQRMAEGKCIPIGSELPMKSVQFVGWDPVNGEKQLTREEACFEYSSKAELGWGGRLCMISAEIEDVFHEVTLNPPGTGYLLVVVEYGVAS